MWRMAESTFGAGWKSLFLTVAISFGVPKRWTWRASTLMSGSLWQIFSATSFWTRKVMDSGWCSFWRKRFRRGEVM